jgi:hypothetical protein
MAAPKFAPVDPTERPRAYESPNAVPESWTLGRPGDVVGKQPTGSYLGHQGPDQGFALTIARRVSGRIRVQSGESLDDAIRGTVVIALRRASMYGRAPVIHDVTFALTIWGWLLDNPPVDLVERRKELFGGLGHAAHSYYEARELVDLVPDTTFKLSNEQLASQMPMSWKAFTGA